MKIILISERNEFDDWRLKQLKAFGEVERYISEETDVNTIEFPKDEEYILAFSPVSYKWNLNPDFYEKLNKVKAICLPTTSFDFLDLEWCKEKDIKVTNIPNYSTRAVAEYGIFLMMCLLKKLPMQIKNDFKYEFTPETLGKELPGMKIGIMSLGHIGRELATTLKSMNLEVSYWSRASRDDRFNYLELEDLISQSDILFATFAINLETTKLISKELMAKMKKRSYLIDLTGREFFDKKTLCKKVEDGFLGGIAFESPDSKIADFKGNVMVTAPLAWYTKESVERNIEIWKDTIISCTKKRPINLVN